MILIQLFVFTTIAVGLQHLLYNFQIIRGRSWYHAIRHNGEGWKYWRVLVILWIALILSEEVTYIIGRKLYE